ncbi:MAG: hypothetical protein MHM6MM_005747 [Cercozoa sp. M6MM]
MTLSVTGMAQMSSTEVADLLRSRGIPEEAVDALVMRSVNGSAIIAMDRHALQQFGVLAGAAQSQILRELQSITGLTLEEREQLMSRSARSKSAFSVVSDSPSNSSDSLDESAFPEAAEWKHRGRSNTCVLADNDDLAATSGTSVLMPYGNMPKTNTLLGLQPERTGTLLKKELFGWKKRFLLLKGDLLFWLKERTDSKPAGRIWLLDPSTVVTPKSELELSITVHQKTHSFRARNISSMKEWTKAIQRAKESRLASERRKRNQTVEAAASAATLRSFRSQTDSKETPRKKKEKKKRKKKYGTVRLSAAAAAELSEKEAKLRQRELELERRERALNQVPLCLGPSI